MKNIVKQINTKKILKELKTSDYVVSCGMPLGYVQGYPILQIKNGSLCMTVPYLKYKTTGVVDKTLVFPVRYAVTISLPDRRVAAYRDLSFEESMENVDFEKPIGLFRHEEIKSLSKSEYQVKRNELFLQYDKIIQALLGEGAYTEKDEETMRELLQLLAEPCLLPIYKYLDEDFYNKYLV